MSVQLGPANVAGTVAVTLKLTPEAPTDPFTLVDLSNESGVTLNVSIGTNAYNLPPQSTVRYPLNGSEQVIIITPQTAPTVTGSINGVAYRKSDNPPLQIARGSNFLGGTVGLPADRIPVATNSTILLGVIVGANANDSFQILGSGELNWFDGTATLPDTGLYRSGVKTMTFDDGGGGPMTLAIVGALSTTGRGTINGGLDVAGSASGYNGGEVRFTTATASVIQGISDVATGSPRMQFDHRGAANTGDFKWGIGTNGGTILALMSAASFLVNSAFIQCAAFEAVGVGGVNRYYQKATDAAVDSKVWDQLASGATLLHRILNDAENSSTTWLTITRGASLSITSAAFNTKVLTTGVGTAAGPGTSQGLVQVADNDNHSWESDGLGGWVFRNIWNSTAASFRFYGVVGGNELLRLATDITFFKHLATSGTAPGFSSAWSTGSGAGTDMAGTMTLTNNSFSPGTISVGQSLVTVTFATTYTTTPRVVVSPMTLTAAQLAVYINVSTSAFTIFASTTQSWSLGVSGTWNYYVIQ